MVGIGRFRWRWEMVMDGEEGDDPRRSEVRKRDKGSWNWKRLGSSVQRLT